MTFPNARILFVDDDSDTREMMELLFYHTNRATVTMSAIALQETGYIKYSRGLINIKDREGLVDFSCECYKIIKKEYDRLPT